MPPITLQGIVTKVGYMNKTATVTVSNYFVHKPTLKVRFPFESLDEIIWEHND